MDVIPEDGKKRIVGKEVLTLFLDNSGLYLVKIAARTGGKENLRIEIDSKKFPAGSPADFNGSKLKGLKATIFFILPLKNGKHTVSLTADQGADLEGFQVARLTEGSTFAINDINDQAEDGDRRPWVTFVLIDLSLMSVTPTITYSRRKRDSDDVKIIIDGKTQGNLFKTVKHFLWRFAGSLLPKGDSKTETETFTPNLPQGLHYIEFWADRMPVLKDVKLNIGVVPLIPKRIPTVDDPEWTGDFNDDTDQILLARLILGEMEGQPDKAKIGVGFTVFNRLKKKKPNWGYTIREIILKKNQYDAFVNENTSKKVQDPLKYASEEEWQDCYKIAGQVLSGGITDPTTGATHFYSTPDDKGSPSWATDDTFKAKLGITYFYELES